MEPEYHKCATVASLGARSVRWVERGETSSREIVPVPAARRAKIFLGAAPIDSLTIQLLGPNFQCTLVGHGGRNDTTGSNGRDDCCVARSDRSIAASTRTVRRARPPRVASVRQDPNSVAPGVLFCCTNLLIRAQRFRYFAERCFAERQFNRRR